MHLISPAELDVQWTMCLWNVCEPKQTISHAIFKYDV